MTIALERTSKDFQLKKRIEKSMINSKVKFISDTHAQVYYHCNTIDLFNAYECSKFIQFTSHIQIPNGQSKFHLKYKIQIFKNLFFRRTFS